MPTYVALLRAINLGAKRKFPKVDGQRVVEETGASDVAVHLNTGNVRLTSRQRSTEAVATFTAREAPGECAVVRGRTVHLMLDAPERYHSSKLPPRVEKDLGVGTNRNLSVVRDLAQRWT